jgi:hypothetical protein
VGPSRTLLEAVKSFSIIVRTQTSKRPHLPWRHSSVKGRAHEDQTSQVISVSKIKTQTHKLHNPSSIVPQRRRYSTSRSHSSEIDPPDPFDPPEMVPGLVPFSGWVPRSETSVAGQSGRRARTRKADTSQAYEAEGPAVTFAGGVASQRVPTSSREASCSYILLHSSSKLAVSVKCRVKQRFQGS